METILITGASGVIGTHLTSLLQKKGYRVTHLSRSSPQKKNVETFVWDVSKQLMDDRAVREADYIVHLAGAGIADERWTPVRKKEIIDSRVESVRLLYNTIQKSDTSLKGFISASAVGFYGAICSGKIYSEEDVPASDFLGTVCKKWEDAADSFSQLNTRVVKLRTGVVLSEKGGALERITRPIKLFVGSPLGSGKQYVPWIHLDDICAMYLKAIEDNQMHGAYNAVAPEHITNQCLTKMIAHILHRPLIMPKIPKAAIKFLFGEMGTVVLEGSRVSCKKIQDKGFEFKFPGLNAALKELFHSD